MHCKLCEGSGIYYKPDGEDDFTSEYCVCDEGVIAEKRGAMKVLEVKWKESVGKPDVFLIN